MDERIKSVGLDDLLTATASGVLRALEARSAGGERFSSLALVKSGFIVDIHITAGGFPGPIFNRQGLGGFRSQASQESLSEEESQ